MTEPTGDPSLAQDPNLVTNSDNLLLDEKVITLIITTEALDSEPKRRQVNDSPDTLVTQVVQTVSLVHYVNTDGVTRATSTLYANPQTVLVDPASGEVVRPVDNDPSEPPPPSVPPAPPAATDASESPEAPEPISTDNPEPPGASQSSTPASPESAVSPDSPEASIPAPPVSSVVAGLDIPPTSVEPALTSLPNIISDLPVLPSGDITSEPTYTELPLESSLSDELSASLGLPSAFPTLTPVNPLPDGFFNSTNFNRTALIRPFGIASTTLLPSSSLSPSPSRSSTSTTRTRSTDLSVVTSSSGSTPGGGGGGGGGSHGLPEADATATDGDDAPTPTGTLVGSVVGSVAGAALIVFLVMAVLRWRKQKSGRVRLGDDLGDSGTRGLGAAGGPSGSGGGGGSGGMAQRSHPFTVPAVLASMSSYNKNRPGSGGAQSGEQGFYRVSGKKLPPVIQFGGDGFSDPRHSTISHASSAYPDSQMDFEQGAAPRLMLGQPMRPVSGIPVMRSSPARTPMAEQNPFADPSPMSPGRLDPDAIGRSLTAQDASRGSSSRFTEVL